MAGARKPCCHQLAASPAAPSNAEPLLINVSAANHERPPLPSWTRRPPRMASVCLEILPGFFFGEALRSDPPRPLQLPRAFSCLVPVAEPRRVAWRGVAWLGTAPSSGLQWMTAPPLLPGATQLHKCFSFLRRYVHNTGSRRDSEVPVKAGKKKKFSKLNQSGKVILAGRLSKLSAAPPSLP